MFVSGKLFQPNLNLWVRSRAYPRVYHPVRSLLKETSAFLAKLRLNWESLPETNTVAFYENSQITAIKSFMTIGPGLAPRLDQGPMV